jgi:hypothetical protein
MTTDTNKRFGTEASDQHALASTHHRRSAECFLSGARAEGEQERLLALTHSKLAREAEARIKADTNQDREAAFEAAWKFMG